jgi:4-diphosphocytidyl-2C-methyl-D-erythritol kinase
VAPPVAGCAEVTGSGGTFYIYTDAANARSAQEQRPVATCRWTFGRPTNPRR